LDVTIKKKSLAALILACSLLIGACSREDPKNSVPSGTPVIITSQTTEAPLQHSNKPSLHVRPDVAANGDIVILMTGDMHCGFDKNFGMGGVYEVRYQLELKGDTVLLVDNGDAVQGDILGYTTKGSVMIDLMNDLGYDVAIPGVNEFHYGIDRFYEIVKQANYDYICCNLLKEGKQVLKPYVIKEVCGKKVAFVGVTTPKALTLAPDGTFQDASGNYIYSFMQDENGQTIAKAVQESVDKARAEGAQYVILMGHIGNEEASAPWTFDLITTRVKGVDAYLDSYSHDGSILEYIDAEGNKRTRIPAGKRLSGIGWIRISSVDGAVTTGFYSYTNEMNSTDLFDIVNPMTKRVEEVKRANGVE
jgi:2',3'-cyclic-nucleotide 2'-phosphodiesterase (5'-nucleotidase family)